VFIATLEIDQVQGSKTRTYSDHGDQGCIEIIRCSNQVLNKFTRDYFRLCFDVDHCCGQSKTSTFLIFSQPYLNQLQNLEDHQRDGRGYHGQVEQSVIVSMV
jgi:hypothetical protein